MYLCRSNGIIQPTWKTLKYVWHSTGIPYRKQQGSFTVTQEQGVCQSTSLGWPPSLTTLFFFKTPHCDGPLKDIGSMEMNSFECGMWNPQAWWVVFVVSSSVPQIELGTAVDAPVGTEVRSSKNWNPSLEVLLWVHTAKVVGKLLFDWNIGYESSFKQNALKPQPFVAAFHCHPLQLTVGVEHLHVGWSHNTSTCDKRRIQALA